MLVAGARAQDAGAAVHAAAATSRATTNLDRWEHAFQARAELSAVAAAEASQPGVSTDVPPACHKLMMPPHLLRRTAVSAAAAPAWQTTLR